MKLYKVFVGVESSSALLLLMLNILHLGFNHRLVCIPRPRLACCYADPGANSTTVGTKAEAVVAPSSNKAERAAVAELLEGKVASMGKPAVGAGTIKNQAKTKKDHV